MSELDWDKAVRAYCESLTAQGIEVLTDEEMDEWRPVFECPVTPAQAEFVKKALKAAFGTLDLASLRSEHNALNELLSDPKAVHVNMLRGSIAKPALADIIHVYPELASLQSERDKLRETLTECEAKFTEYAAHRQPRVSATSREAVDLQGKLI
jgi:hypothetical protein